MHKKEVIPTLFALDKENFNRKLTKISFSKKIHLDFMDGKFTQSSSISLNDMNEILNFKTIDFEIHLMAYEPEQYIGKIKKLGIKKVLIQFEAFETNTELMYSIETFKERELEVLLVINPGTDLEEVYPYFNEVSGVMIMSVWPGKEGQKFIENTYNKLLEIRKKFPNVIIQVDGGISEKNASEILKSGADILSVGSYISSNENAEENFNKLSQILNSIK